VEGRKLWVWDPWLGVEYDDFLINLKGNELARHDPCPGCALVNGVMQENLHLLIFISSEYHDSIYMRGCALYR
jgi:hypothetical protein